MPHFIIEHGNAFATAAERQAAMKLAADCGAASGFILPEDIKVRLHRYADFLAVDGRRSFAHITVRMLEGRSADQKTALSVALRQAFSDRFPALQSLSIEICDMHAESYKKHLGGPY